MRQLFFARSLLLTLLISTGLSAIGAPITTLCYQSESRLNKRKLQSDLNNLHPLLAAVYRMYETRTQATPVLERAFPRPAIYELLRHPEGEFLMHAMDRVLTAVDQDGSRVTNQERANLPAHLADLTREEQDTLAKVRRQLAKELKDKVPEDQLEERLSMLGNGDRLALERALGYLTVEDAAILVHGGNPLAPTPNSLLGKYIAETGAAKIVRTFGTGLAGAVRSAYTERPIDPNSRQGPERLVVALSQESLPTYLKYFEIPNLMVHLHGPQQSTLYIGFMGQSGSYGRVYRDGSSPIRISEGAIWPHILLSTSEGGRARAYFDIAESNRIARQPWLLEGFCATGGYTSCTHWWGEMGIGDRRVTEWVFPGAVDEHATRSGDGGTGPRVQPLGAYRVPGGTPRIIAARIKRLMTYPTAGEQLAVMVGTRPQLEAAEWANPGYVALTLLSRASPERVPFLFYVVPNHRRRIDRNFDPQVSAY